MSVSSEMNCLWFLSILSVFVLSLWEKPGCEATTLSSVLLRQVSGGGGDGGGAAGGVHSHHRRKRSWVWNQFFVLEEYTGDEPLYVGKVRTL